MLIILYVALGFATLVWIALHADFHRWGRRWTLDRGPDQDPFGRSVSGDLRVCIPARNEAGRIGACVAAVLRSDAAREVIVVDDGSDDGTAEEARRAGAGDPRLVVRTARPRPPGWAGKPWACQEAASDATTGWLLFLDADVVVDPHAPAAAVERAERDRVVLLSLFGSWALESFWERVAIPAIGWFIRGAVDLDAVNEARPHPLLPAFANGQFLLVRGDTWRAMGGHGAVRGEVLDDVRLAEAVRARGEGMRLLWAPWAFRVRLYEGLSQIVSGYRKNLYEGMRRRPALALLGAAVVLVTTALPPIVVFVGPPAVSAWALALTVAMIAFRWRLERRDGRSGVVAPLHPLAGLALAGVLLASMKPVATWKGRRFVGGHAAPDPRNAEPPSGKPEGGS